MKLRVLSEVTFGATWVALSHNLTLLTVMTYYPIMLKDYLYCFNTASRGA